jgi:hypothetical protein
MPDIITPPPNPIAKMAKTVPAPAKNDGTLNVLNGIAGLRFENVETARLFPCAGTRESKVSCDGWQMSRTGGMSQGGLRLR